MSGLWLCCDSVNGIEECLTWHVLHDMRIWGCCGVFENIKSCRVGSDLFFGLHLILFVLRISMGYPIVTYPYFLCGQKFIFGEDALAIDFVWKHLFKMT